MTKRRLALCALLMAAATLPAAAADSVLWDDNGKALLSGTYNFREVMWRNHGDTHRIAIYGSIQFDGNGGYTLSSSVMDSNASSVQSFSTTGAYRISASGMGFMDDPLHATNGKPLSAIWGLISQGVFVGSSSDDAINNLFIAALAPSSPTNASFNGSYWAAAVNLPSSDTTQARDMLFRLNPNGQGSLGTLNLTGLIGTDGTAVSQTVNATYSFSNGAMNLAFGGSLGSQTLIAGDELSYLSADGNFFFGGSRTGWDMIVGVRAFSGNVPSNALSGMYYQAGVDVAPAKGFDDLITYFGAFSAGSGTIIGHQRLLTADPSVNYAPFDFTYSEGYTLDPNDGSHDDFLGIHSVLGAGGAIQIGFGNESRLGIKVTLKAPVFSGTGVFLDPTGIANAASSAPFTVGVSPGGFIALYGSNLAPATLLDSRMPLSLGGVQVLINGRPAPLYVVSSGFISAIVPYATSGPVASIQVINGGSSATRTVRVKNGTPGIYTNPAGGVGYLIAQHVQDNSYATITKQNPAHPGETILLYLTGLGAVSPPVGDGVPAPSDHLTNAVIQPFALVDLEPATVGFAGLTPTIVGLYAITLTIPTDIAPGDAYVDIALPDSYTTEAQIPIGGSGLALQQLDSAKGAARPETGPASLAWIVFQHASPFGRFSSVTYSALTRIPKGQLIEIKES